MFNDINVLQAMHKPVWLCCVLVIKNDFTGYVDLTSCEILNAEVVGNALLS